MTTSVEHPPPFSQIIVSRSIYGQWCVVGSVAPYWWWLHQDGDWRWGSGAAARGQFPSQEAAEEALALWMLKQEGER